MENIEDSADNFNTYFDKNLLNTDNKIFHKFKNLICKSLQDK